MLMCVSVFAADQVASTGMHYGLYHAVDHYPSPHHQPLGPGPLLYDRAETYGEGPRHLEAATLLHG